MKAIPTHLRSGAAPAPSWTIPLILFCALLFFLFLSSAAFSQDKPPRVLEFWHREIFEGEVGKDITLRLGKQFRYHGGNPYYQDTDSRVIFNRRRNFEWDIGYRWALSQGAKDWQLETRPYLSGTFKWKLGEFDLEWRNRFEERYFHFNREDHLRYRNRIRFKYPVNLGKYWVNAYISDELFIDVKERNGGPKRNRFCIGLKNSEREAFHSDIFFLYQSNEKHRDEGSPLKELEAINITLKFKF